MAIPYDDITKEAAIRVNAVAGSIPSTKVTNLAVNPLTATQVGSVEFPFTTLQRAVLSAVGRIIRTYANIKNQPLRLFNESLTANIAHLGTIPTVNSSSKTIVGIYGAIVDASDGKILTEQPIQLIDSILRSKADTSLKKEYYYYKIEGGIIYHTRTNVKIKVCTFDLATEKALIGTSSAASPLPDSLYDVAWMATLAELFTDSAYAEQASLCNQYVENAFAQMRNGAATFDPAPAFTLSQSAAN